MAKSRSGDEVAFGPQFDGLRGSEVILVVEDEEPVRSLITRTLRGLGYFVLEARQGEDALAVLHQYHGPAHLLITDLVMPELGGAPLIDLLFGSYPNLRVLIVSGYDAPTLQAKGALNPDARFLAKPFAVEALARTVREILDA
jgi:CheY-like chemotaxis protein